MLYEAAVVGAAGGPVETAIGRVPALELLLQLVYDSILLLDSLREPLLLLSKSLHDDLNERLDGFVVAGFFEMLLHLCPLSDKCAAIVLVDARHVGVHALLEVGGQISAARTLCAAFAGAFYGLEYAVPSFMILIVVDCLFFSIWSFYFPHPVLRERVCV